MSAVILTGAIVWYLGSGYGPVPHAPVSAAQRAALSRYYLVHEWPQMDWGPAARDVACPIDILGASRASRQLRVYTVVTCADCAAGGQMATTGFVATLTGTSVSAVRMDDSPGYTGMIDEASVYPPSIRSTAINDIDYASPQWLAQRAIAAAGCHHPAR